MEAIPQHSAGRLEAARSWPGSRGLSAHVAQTCFSSRFALFQAKVLSAAVSCRGGFAQSAQWQEGPPGHGHRAGDPQQAGGRGTGQPNARSPCMAQGRHGATRQSPGQMPIDMSLQTDEETEARSGDARTRCHRKGQNVCKFGFWEPLAAQTLPVAPAGPLVLSVRHWSTLCHATPKGLPGLAIVHDAGGEGALLSASASPTFPRCQPAPGASAHLLSPPPLPGALLPGGWPFCGRCEGVRWRG